MQECIGGTPPATSCVPWRTLEGAKSARRRQKCLTHRCYVLCSRTTINPQDAGGLAMGTEKQLLTAAIAAACLTVAGVALAAQPVNKPVLRHARFIFRGREAELWRASPSRGSS